MKRFCKKLNTSKLLYRRPRLESLEERAMMAVFSGMPDCADQSSITAETAPFAAGENNVTRWIVNSLNDTKRWSRWDTEVTLREAVSRAAEGDRITFAEDLSGGTITLCGSELEIGKGITIDASEIGGIAIDAGEQSRCISVYCGREDVPVTLISLSVTGGKTSGFGGGIYNCSGELLLRGVTVISNSADMGGGIYNDSGSVTFLGAVLTQNTASTSGGGVYNSSGELSLQGVTVISNSADTGGGIYNDTGSVTLSGGLMQNTASTFGGGAYNSSGEFLLQEASIIINSADMGGGIYNDSGSLSVSYFCGISENTASTSGGGICNGFEGTANLTNSYFTQNSAQFGGGICNQGELTLTDCFISFNNAEYGGGIENGSRLSMTNCVVLKNSATGRGGGIENYYETLILSNCTITGNSAEKGGGIYNFGDPGEHSTAKLYNTIVLFNTANLEGNDIGTENSLNVINAYHTLSSFTDWTESVSAFVYDPDKSLFTDPENDDYTLAENSQAIDVGNNAYVSAETDFAGKERIVNGFVDLGAFEYQLPEAAVSTKITVTFSPPAEPESDDPYSEESVVTGEPIYVSVWVKSGNSDYGVQGGYCSLYYSESVEPYSYFASPLFSEDIVVGFDGDHISGFGGYPESMTAAYGADTWVLAGTYLFAAKEAGTIYFSTAVATKNCVEKPSWNFILENGENSNSYDAILIDVQEFVLETPEITTGSNGIFVSCGANRHYIQCTASRDAEGYELQYSTDGGQTWKEAVSGTCRVLVEELPYGAEVQYRIRAFTIGSAPSDWSAVKTFTVCPMDVDNDGDVAGTDRSWLMRCWLSSEGDEEYRYFCDIDGDGDIAGTDRNFLSKNWLNEVGEDEMTYPKPVAPSDFLFERLEIYTSWHFDELFGDQF